MRQLSADQSRRIALAFDDHFSEAQVGRSTAYAPRKPRMCRILPGSFFERPQVTAALLSLRDQIEATDWLAFSPDEVPVVAWEGSLDEGLLRLCVEQIVVEPQVVCDPSLRVVAISYPTANVTTLFMDASLHAVGAHLDEALKGEETFEAWIAAGRVGFGSPEEQAWARTLKTVICA